MSTRKKIKYSSWVFLNISFIVWLIFFLIKVSGKFTTWSWFKVFSPLYITFFIAFFFVTSATINSSYIEYLIWSVLSWASLAIFSIMISIKLDSPNNENLNLIYCLIPLWVFLGLLLLLRLDPPSNRNRNANTMDNTSIVRVVRYKSRGLKKTIKVFYPSAIVYFAIYTILELISQTTYQLSWTIRFIPFFIFIGTTFSVLLTNISKPGWEMFIPSFISCFLILLYLYFIDKIGHIAIAFIPIYLLIPIQFVFGFFV